MINDISMFTTMIQPNESDINTYDEIRSMFSVISYDKGGSVLLNFHGNLFYPSFQGNGRLQLLSYLAEDSSKACHPTHILNVAPSCSSINLLVLRDLMKRE